MKTYLTLNKVRVKQNSSPAVFIIAMMDISVMLLIAVTVFRILS